MLLSLLLCQLTKLSFNCRHMAARGEFSIVVAVVVVVIVVVVVVGFLCRLLGLWHIVYACGGALGLSSSCLNN